MIAFPCEYIFVNELNFNIVKSGYEETIKYLESILGNIYRVRLTKLLPGTTIPWHKDETPNEYMRLIIPIITDDECINGFRIGDQYHYEYLPIMLFKPDFIELHNEPRFKALVKNTGISMNISLSINSTKSDFKD